jgi:acyl carrier protein
MNSRREQALAVVASVLGMPVDALTLDLARGAHPAWDSLRHLDLVMELEAVMGWRLSLDDVTRMKSVADVIARADAERG